MGGSGGGSGNGGTSEVRYADYIESRHKVFLNTYATKVSAAIDSSPYSDYSEMDLDDAFFGSGVAITSFVSLFDTYELFLKDYDTDAAYTTAVENTINTDVIKNLVQAEGAIMSEDIENNVLPRLMTGIRDIGAVSSSSFYIAKGNVEAERIRNLAKYSAELKYRMLSMALERWKTNLSWHQSIVDMYSKMFQLYFAGKLDADNVYYSIKAKDSLWPFTVLDYQKAGLGAMQGAVSTSTGETAGTAQKAIGGALSGASAGAMVGGLPGAGVGGLLGLATSFF